MRQSLQQHMSLPGLAAAALVLLATSAAAAADDAKTERPHHPGLLAARAAARREAANVKVNIPGAMSHWLGFKDAKDYSTQWDAAKGKHPKQPKLAAVAAASAVEQGNPYLARLHNQPAPSQADGGAASTSPAKKKKKSTLLRSGAHVKMTAAEKAYARQHAFDDLELPAGFGGHADAALTAVGSQVKGGNTYLAAAGLEQPSAEATAQQDKDDNSYVATLMGQQKQRTMRLQEKQAVPNSGNNYLDAILPAKYVGLEH
eukprot:TRINITY_DN74248_c0_g1_i1.p1 TRINITY_DN74248_c0_g1~~TRINITY_DN74248_c0_g1_i1.p1  ORF type:complete len:259 (+),score=97.25 TRINITY_DN74248_c0_g1_i1:81-857(+)